MTTPGTLARLRFEENMKQVQVGATLRRDRSSHEWTIVKSIKRETGVELTLQCGRRRLSGIHVFVSFTGPDLYELGLTACRPAPTQRDLLGGHA